MKIPIFIKNTLRNIQNFPGHNTTRKIVVIESDDWGSIRMPSRKTYDSLLSMGYSIEQNHYNRYDSLESNEDIEILFDTLFKFKDVNGNHPIITANNIVANPDFRRIELGGFKEYFFEPFNLTYDNYPNHEKVFELMKSGIGEGLFKPQFHGRDHVNVASWLRALQHGNKNVHLAFSNGMIYFNSNSSRLESERFINALYFETKKEKEYIEKSLIEGIRLFKEIWSFSSDSFIAPCYVWNSEMEKILFFEGVKFLQGLYIQYEPSLKNRDLYKMKFHYFGQQNHSGQFYLVRNATFEPSSGKHKDPVGNCLKEIAIAFRWNKPAIICSHRVNYIGSIDQENRTQNIILLKFLLTEILKKWPEVEFMSSDMLGMQLESLHKLRS